MTKANAVIEAPSRPRFRPPLAVLVVAAEGAAAVILVAAQLFLPWFQITYPKNIALPPGPYSWGDWHSGFVDQAVLLTFVAPFVSLAAFAGSVETFGDAGVINPTPGATTTPGVGLWLFAVAAVVGLVAVAADFVLRSVSPRS